MNRHLAFIPTEVVFIKWFLTIVVIFFALSGFSQGVEGYYRYPALRNETVVFTAEGDLWSVPLAGGLARRLTTHPGEETHPVISPDGQTIGFTASYEGPDELYTMPLSGGLPERRTYEGESSVATTWTPRGELVYATTHYSTLPDWQMVKVDLKTKRSTRIPLSQATEGCFDASGKTLFFVRPAYHNNVTKRYKGGTARQIWRYTEGTPEAVKLTTGYAGESHHPMWWKNRVYFITDRDGIMNIWSMNEQGKDLKQHSRQKAFDVRDAALDNGRIVYQSGADLWLYDIGTGQEKVIPIKLVSDLDQLREKWVTNPREYITSAHLSPNGDRLAITARGRVFVVPAGDGRLVQLSRKEGVRYRDAVFSSDGKDILVLSDETGEFEFMKVPATGIGPQEALTADGKILRFQAVPSPDGKWLAFDDYNRDLWLLKLADGALKKISTNREGIGAIAWSPDSRWLAFVQTAENTFAQIFLYGNADGSLNPLTTDRVNSVDPVWSPDGEWLYFLSDRNFETLVGAPWGSRQPEPYFDRKWKLYQVSLRKGTRSPFKPADELDATAADEKKETGKKDSLVRIDLDGMSQRLRELPVKPGNYRGLAVNDKAVYWLSEETGLEGKTHLMVLKITNDDPKPVTMVQDVRNFELSADGKKLGIGKGQDFYMVDAGTGPVNNLSDSKVDLGGWSFSLDPREDWKQIFKDAWRMERDYFYDPGMHGLDWKAMYEKYLPLVDRITTREELSDLIGHYVGELSVLHTSVRGGDTRSGPEQVRIASLGARLSRDEAAGGYRIDYIYQTDPDYPDQRSPLADPDLGISNGDVIYHINGDPVLEAGDIGALLRNRAGKQVRIGIIAGGAGDKRDIVVEPVGNESGLRYNDWEYTRRLEVEEKTAGKVGYVHLRAMGGSDLEQWYRDFYPVFNRQGLIVDVRHNRGGNIESFILEKLMRRAWFYWKSRVGEPYWNMQYAFRGHLVVLCDENTASDGEAFAEGVKRLELGKLIGTRTWGGEVWLGSANRLSDGGLARAPMNGVYGPGGEWLIEGHGVEPDIEVLNLPHAAFNGQDAQLDAAIRYLLEEIRKDPRAVPAPPAYPDKSVGNGKG